jgi:site-specific DNA-methyltransferase (adenine-specific)
MAVTKSNANKLSQVAQLGQYMTPSWAARELWAAHFSHIGSGKTVLEPTCGDGRMLQAVPPHVDAFGIEIDPVEATKARERTGRQVITGDVLSLEFPRRFDVVFGNPKFKAGFLDSLLDKIALAASDGCECGLLVPAYFMQTPSRVLRWNRVWTIYPELLPRTLFPRSRLPIIFALFTKDPVPQLKGMRLFVEADAISCLKPEYREMMEKGRGLWDPVVEHALRELDGKAHLTLIYERVGRRRPTDNPYWREKVRQTLQRDEAKYQPCGNGVWELVPKAA